MTVQLGLLLALGCAFATNLAFLWKHKGAVAGPRRRHPPPAAQRRRACSPPSGGRSASSVALVAWVLHVAALALAPISLVQAVISGGLVFLAVLADRWFGFELGKREWMGVALTAIGLAFLGLTVQTGSRGLALELLDLRDDRLRGRDGLPRRAAPAHRTASSVIRHRRGLMLGAAAGILFGVSDISIKALTGTVPGDFMSIISPWTLVAVAGLDRRLLRLGPRPAGRRGRVGDRAHVGVGEPAARSSAASSCSATRWAATPFEIVARGMAFAMVLVATALMPAPMRAASRTA